MVERLGAARAELDPPPGKVDARRLNAQSEVDLLFAIELLGAQRQAGAVHRALEERLRQRRALVGQVGLAREQDDRIVRAFLAQTGRGLDAGVTGADDDDRTTRHKFPWNGAESSAPPSTNGPSGKPSFSLQQLLSR